MSPFTTVLLATAALASSAPPSDKPACGGDLGELRVGDVFAFSTPGYDEGKPYPPNVRCPWKFSVPGNSWVYLRCPDFDLAPRGSGDRVEMVLGAGMTGTKWGRPERGETRFPLWQGHDDEAGTSQDLAVTFVSGDSAGGGHAGFNCTVDATEPRWDDKSEKKKEKKEKEKDDEAKA